jgi:hypothetical protein
VPLKRRCSMKCETPARSARSSREPTSIQKPSATERTLAVAVRYLKETIAATLGMKAG